MGEGKSADADVVTGNEGVGGGVANVDGTAGDVWVVWAPPVEPDDCSCCDCGGHWVVGVGGDTCDPVDDGGVGGACDVRQGSGATAW